ncbi:hypothetical protein BJ741DRAFT_632097 [Chytriomyces cf. hyalinus JEL632]|nr:hypothetical protein BJ741DRAFT_632097 [Chytriomyces cf. hyalinus JEL632]
MAHMACMTVPCPPNTMLSLPTKCICYGLIITASTACGYGYYCASTGAYWCLDAIIGKGFACLADNGMKCTRYAEETTAVSGCSTEACRVTGGMCTTGDTCYIRSFPASSAAENDKAIGTFGACLHDCTTDNQGPVIGNKIWTSFSKAKFAQTQQLHFVK